MVAPFIFLLHLIDTICVLPICILSMWHRFMQISIPAYISLIAQLVQDARDLI